jgi:tetratricopeptide (TPR) repeat protein
MALVAALSFAIAVADGEDSSAAYNRTLSQARAALQRNDFGRGLDLIDQAVRMNPRGWEALSLLGRAYLHLESFPQAIAALRRATAILKEEAPDPGTGSVEKRAQAMISIAVALQEQERSDEAIDVLREVLSLSPGRLTIHHDMGRIFIALGRLQEAAIEFREEISLQKAAKRTGGQALGMAHEGLGIAASTMGDDKTALEAFDSLSALPDFTLTVEGRYHLGLVLSRVERHEEAAAAFRTVLEGDPGHRGALQSLARSAQVLGLAEERKSALQRFQTLYLEDETNRRRAVRVKNLIADAQRESGAGDLEAAVALMEEAVQLDPTKQDIQTMLASLLRRTGDPARAKQIVREVLEKQPLNALAHHELGRIQTANGDLVAALASLEQAARLEPMSTTFHTSLAQMYFRMRRNEDGLREMRMASSMDPDNPEARFNLGAGLAQAGAMREAASELEAAIEMGFADPVVHWALAQVYFRLGDRERGAAEQKIYEEQTADRAPAP